MGMIGQLIVQTIIDGVALWIAALVIDGLHFNGDLLALALTAILFSVVNFVVRPFVIMLTLPLSFVTFGLFLLVINALMLMLTGFLSRAYTVDGFWPALLGSILISLANLALYLVTGYRRSGRTNRPSRPVSGDGLGDT